MPPLGPSISRRRALILGGGAVVATLGSAVGALELLRRSAVLDPSSLMRAPRATPVSAEAEADEPWPPPPLGVSTTVPTEFQFTVDPDVPAGDVQLLRSGAVIARDFYFRTMGVYLTGRPYIHIEGRAVTVVNELGDANGATIRIYAGHQQWPSLSDTQKVEVVCHEIFHLMQAGLSRGTQPAVLYLVEGTAEYAGQAAVIDAGMRTFADFRAREEETVRRYPQPVISKVNYDSGFGNYPLGALAIDQLVGERGVGVLGKYFTLLGQRSSPADAFEEAFGESRVAFEDRFERWRIGRGLPAR